MSLHKLTAGSGYDYLTRQVAAMDATDKGHLSLASYYSERGELPGVWRGSGLADLEGLSAGELVTAAQMKSLFAHGFHPLADERVAALGSHAGEPSVRAAQRLGKPFKVFENDVPDFHVEVARRLQEFSSSGGRRSGAPLSLGVRAKIRSQVATEKFVVEHGREPTDARELAATIARLSRPRTTAVAGYDLTFSPVKSVSALWAVAEPRVAAAIERAHDAAVDDALAFIESRALFTRTGTNGVRQVDVRGLVAASFTHRDSRAGDPDLHTHVAVANKVQTVEDGRWLAIDGRLIFQANVPASEVYNTALEKHLGNELGLSFSERPCSDPRKGRVREVVGVDGQLIEHWSSRRADIRTRQEVLSRKFQSEHARPPTPVEAIQLAQQATLETREAKHEPRTLMEQRADWATQAASILGDEEAVVRMVRNALTARRTHSPRPDRSWISSAASTVVGNIEARRSTWQVWHLIAEAQRQVRRAALRPDQIQIVVDLVVDEAIRASTRLVSDLDPIPEPLGLRRESGASVYTVAGSDLFTSTTILAAEERIIEAAGRDDGRRLTNDHVDDCLASPGEDAVKLNADQASLVRQMATSGARVQLAIAAAGTGKTTAMSALTRAWEASGGTVVGLAPSAVAAAQLREQISATTDTLAKLISDIDSLSSRLVDRIGPDTLVLIDEAGMADTLSLDAAIRAALARGASVRLVGDDRQLAAIGAGGVLRDIACQYGAIRLGELMRFSDPAEGAATLALREGRPEALGYYLDQQRVHTGNLVTATDGVFTAWQQDRSNGLDAIMLAPTRDLVADLNARAHRARAASGDILDTPGVKLSDDNTATVGDIIITRRNERRLAISGSDWVKNGDRWHVTEISPHALTVAHAKSGLRATLPTDYVRQHVELGYASTVHTAQGVSADVTHGLVTGEEDRQQLYTMCTRGKLENHLYVVVAGEGDPHDLIRPETVHPRTATDVLETVLARDSTPTSASSTAEKATSPDMQLGQAVARYVDALHFAAESVIGQSTVANLEQQADSLVPGILDEPAWPALRSHLMLLQAQRRDAAADLATCVGERELDGVHDRAAVLDWRLDPTGLRGTPPGPLSWLPGIPEMLRQDPRWAGYLLDRHSHVENQAAAVRTTAESEPISDWTIGLPVPTPELHADVVVWRAANQVPLDDHRPTGPPLQQKALALHQRHLDRSLRQGRGPALTEWKPLLEELRVPHDDFTSMLVERLATLSRAGVDASRILRTAATRSPLPDDHASAALWWRVSHHVDPRVTAQRDPNDTSTEASWEPELIRHLGTDGASVLTLSPRWPGLVASIDHALEAGWHLPRLLDAALVSAPDDIDPAQAMIWRIALLTDGSGDPESSVEDAYYAPPADHRDAAPAVDMDDYTPQPFAITTWHGPSDAEVAREWQRGIAAKFSPVTPQTIHTINDEAAAFYEALLASSWAHLYLQQRLRTDVRDDYRFRPGYAPHAWTAATDHLRARGYSDEELLAAGIAKTASTGRLIDRFRDRLVFPIISNEHVLGFVGRRNPHRLDDHAGPKYLNTPETIAFSKRAQLYGVADKHMASGAIPVLVEGPVDAIAVTTASAGAYLGVAPLGSALTEEQATQIASLHRAPIIATDGDVAGENAAVRSNHLLQARGCMPARVTFEAGHDPAHLLEHRDSTALVKRLQSAADPLRGSIRLGQNSASAGTHPRVGDHEPRP